MKTKQTAAEKAALKLQKIAAHRAGLLLRIATLADVIDFTLPGAVATAEIKTLEAIVLDLKAAARRQGAIDSHSVIARMVASELEAAVAEFVSEGAPEVVEVVAEVIPTPAESAEIVATSARELMAAAPVAPVSVLIDFPAVIAAIRADKKIGTGSGSIADLMSDSELAVHLSKVTKGRGCSVASAVTYYKTAQKKLGDVKAAA